MRTPKCLLIAAALALVAALTWPALADQGQARNASREAAGQQTAQGTIQSVSGEQHQLVLRDQGGKERHFQVSRDARVNIDGQPGKLADLKEGQKVSVSYQLRATEIRSGAEGAAGGTKENPARGRTHTAQGKIQRVSGEQHQLVLRDQGGKERRFQISRDARVNINGQQGQLADLRQGQEVSVSYQMNATEIRSGRQQ